MARVLLVAHDSEQYRLLTWALRDDGVDARCLPPDEIPYEAVRGFDAIVLAVPETPSLERRALIQRMREHCGKIMIADVIPQTAAADSGADRYVTGSVGHEDIMRMLRSTDVDAPPQTGDAQP
jgi:hypothetical protein